MTTYSFTKSPVDINSLQVSIRASAIATVLDHCNLLGSALDIIFRADLSATDQTTLGSIVSAHTGVPLPDPVIIQPVSVSSAPAPAPFAAKTIGTKKLYKRVNGVQSAVIVGSTDILFTVPYAWCKITGLEIIGEETLDRVSLYILDSTTGTYSTIPNYTLNQFGFNVNSAKDYYNHTSEYDADLYLNMQIKVSYTSISAKTIGVNFILNEVK